MEADPQVLDAGIIAPAQKETHYEIAGDGSVRTFARVLGYKDAAGMLEQTLRAETTIDKKLPALAEKPNKRAETADRAPHS